MPFIEFSYTPRTRETTRTWTQRKWTQIPGIYSKSVKFSKVCVNLAWNLVLIHTRLTILLPARFPTHCPFNMRRQAEKLEHEDDANKENEIKAFGTTGSSGGQYGALHKAVNSQLGDGEADMSINVGDTRAVIIMDAHCAIQIANQGA